MFWIKAFIYNASKIHSFLSTLIKDILVVGLGIIDRQIQRRTETAPGLTKMCKLYVIKLH